MGRPFREREVELPPHTTHFIPEGSENEEAVVLKLDEYEAIRLADYLGYSQQESAKKMGVSRPTFTRIIKSAHKKISSAITQGLEIVISGGNFHFRKDILHCSYCSEEVVVEEENVEGSACPECGRYGLYSLGRQFRGGRKGRGKKRRRRKGGFSGRREDEQR